MKDYRVRELEDVKKVFDKFGVKFLVCYGALLGMHRDKKLISNDDDFDLAVTDRVDLKTRKDIGWALIDIGFQPQPIMFNVFGRWEQAEPGYNGDAQTGIIVCQREFKFTIFFFYEDVCGQHEEWEMICTPKVGAMKLMASPSKFFKEFGEIEIGGKKYLTPSPIDDYLASCYINWKSKGGEHSPTYEKTHQV